MIVFVPACPCHYSSDQSGFVQQGLLSRNICSVDAVSMDEGTLFEHDAAAIALNIILSIILSIPSLVEC